MLVFGWGATPPPAPRREETASLVVHWTPPCPPGRVAWMPSRTHTLSAGSLSAEPGRALNPQLSRRAVPPVLPRVADEEPAPRMVHGLRSAPRGRCAVCWECTLCGPGGKTLERATPLRSPARRPIRGWRRHAPCRAGSAAPSPVPHHGGVIRISSAPSVEGARCGSGPCAGSGRHLRSPPLHLGELCPSLLAPRPPRPRKACAASAARQDGERALCAARIPRLHLDPSVPGKHHKSE